MEIEAVAYVAGIVRIALAHLVEQRAERSSGRLERIVVAVVARDAFVVVSRCDQAIRTGRNGQSPVPVVAAVLVLLVEQHGAAATGRHAAVELLAHLRLDPLEHRLEQVVVVLAQRHDHAQRTRHVRIHAFDQLLTTLARKRAIYEILLFGRLLMVITFYFVFSITAIHSF